LIRPSSAVDKTHHAVCLDERDPPPALRRRDQRHHRRRSFFDSLDAPPVARIGSLDTPVPFAPNLEKYYMPSPQDVIVAVKKMM